MKKTLLILVIIAAIGGVLYWQQKKSDITFTNSPTPSSNARADYKNISYVIEGETIPLKNGAYETPVEPDSVEVERTEYFGNEVRGDFNGDGLPDVAFVLVQSGGGTGVFYYVVAALQTPQGYSGTNGIFLGDRIAPQTTEFRNGKIVVNYADRKPGEPFSADPSVGVSKYLKANNNQLVETKP